MISELYEALRSAGVSEEQAQKAAEAVNLEASRLSRMENSMARMETNVGWIRWLMITGFGICFMGLAALIKMLWTLTQMAAI